MIWTREQTKELTDRVLSLSKAEETVVTVNGSERANLRFARNTATTSGASSGTSLAITSSFGKRSGTVTTAQFDNASLERALKSAEEIAKVSPENPEAMPALGPQTYSPVPAYFDDAANASPEWRATSVGDGDRPEQEEGRGVGRVRRDAGGDAGGGELEGSVRLRPLHRRRLQPDGADAGRVRIGLGVEVLQRAAPARSGEARDRRDRQGGAGEIAVGDRARQVHRRSRAGRGRRPAGLHDVLGGRAAGRRRPKLLLEEGRRQSRRRADRRRQAPCLLRSGASAGADDLVRQRRAADRPQRRGSTREC